MAGKFDTNINHYTIEELLSILNLADDQINIDDITVETNKYIYQYKKTDPPTSQFFIEMKKRLLQYVENGETEPEDEWFQHQYIQQKNPAQTDKITERSQKVEVFNNPQLPMKQQQLGVSNTFQVPFAQDVLNPTLTNTIPRFINMDSQFRQSGNSIENSSTNYVADLSDPLLNVLSIRLYSYQIPYTWYTIDSAYSNNCFWLVKLTDEVIPITIPSGNYNASEFVVISNNVINSALSTTGVKYITYNLNNGKITLHTDPTIFKNVIFFDCSGKLMCEGGVCANKTYYMDNTLGWLLGFRVPFINVVNEENTGSTVLDLNGTKYLIIVLDDYNQNHINNGIINIAENSKHVKLPSYFSHDLAYNCLEPTGNCVDTIQSIMDGNENNSNLGLLIADKMPSQYKSIVNIIPNAPRTLTQSQIYTINEIIKNNENNTNYRSKAPTNTDAFSILPIKTSGVSTGTLLVELTGSLQDNKRTYFGPVNIERFHVKLCNDKGQLLNLNGADWCITMIATLLYQY
jgi:hypothetical protein